MVKAMKKNNLDVSFCEIDAQWGHDAFLLPSDHLENLIKGFLRSVKPYTEAGHNAGADLNAGENDEPTT